MAGLHSPMWTCRLGQAPKKARRAAASAARSAAPAAAMLRPPPAAQPLPPPGSCSRAAPWPALALPHHAKPLPMLLPRAGRVSAEACRQRLGGNRRRQPFTFMADGDGPAHSSGGSSGGNGAGASKAARSLWAPNLHTAAHESRARLYRLCLRRSRIAQLGVYTIGACPMRVLEDRAGADASCFMRLGCAYARRGSSAALAWPSAAHAVMAACRMVSGAQCAPRAEHIPAGQLVIEYVGELVRRPVADARERAYAGAGAAGACYMFGLDAVRPG